MVRNKQSRLKEKKRASLWERFDVGEIRGKLLGVSDRGGIGSHPGSGSQIGYQAKSGSFFFRTEKALDRVAWQAEAGSPLFLQGGHEIETKLATPSTVGSLRGRVLRRRPLVDDTTMGLMAVVSLRFRRSRFWSNLILIFLDHLTITSDEYSII
eukprot:scaffold65021_cov87-Cyclotella_meneghiniana.AAC.8